MSSKSSKMIGWIKKRCRRRSDPFGDKLKYSEEKIVEDPIYFTLETNVSPKHSDKIQDVEDHVYEEICNSRESCVPLDIISEMSKMTKNIEVEFTENVNHSYICPICRKNIPKDVVCNCTDMNSVSNKVTAREDNIYELASHPWLSQNERICLEDKSGKLPYIPTYHCEKKVHVDISICDDSSGYYESIGSDNSSTGSHYSPGSNESGSIRDESDDNDYEEIDFKHRILLKRRCSMGSLPLSNDSKLNFNNRKVSTSRSKKLSFKRSFLKE